MKKADINKLYFNEKVLKLELLDIEVESFFLRNRASKELITIPFMNSPIKGAYKLDIQDALFNEIGFMRFDLVCEDQKGILYRPKIEIGNSNYSSMNIGKSYFIIENGEWVNFYITKDHELSFVKGDFNKVLEGSFKTENINIEAETVSYKNGIIQLSFSTEQEIDSFQFYLKNKKNKEALKTLNTEKVEEKTQYFVAIDGELINDQNNYLCISYTVGNLMINAFICREIKKLQENTQLVGPTLMFSNYKDNRITFTKEIKNYLENAEKDKTEFIKTDYSFADNTIMLSAKHFTFEEENIFFIENSTKKTYTKMSDVTLLNEKIMQKINGIPMDKLELNDELRLLMLRTGNEVENKTYTLYRFESIKNKSQLSKSDQREEKIYFPGIQEKFLSPYWSANNELIFQPLDELGYKEVILDKVEKNMSINDIDFSENQLHFKIENSNATCSKMLTFYMSNRSTKERYYLPYFMQENKTFVVDFTEFASSNASLERFSRWDMYVAAEYTDTIEIGKVGCYTSQLEKKTLRYYENFKLEESSSICVVPYLTGKNEVSVVCNTEAKVKKEQIRYDIWVEKNSMRNKRIIIEACFQLQNDEQYELNGAFLKLRNKAMDLEYPVSLNKINKTNDKTTFEIEINTNEFRFIPFYWDIFITILIGKKDFTIRLKNPIEEVKNNITNKILKNEIYFDDHYMLYPYITMDNSYSLCFRKREQHETRKYKIMENMAYHYYSLFKKHYDRKEIWLGFEKESNSAQDNGYEFFNYCYKNNKHKNFYYILKKDSNDTDVVSNQRNKVINYMSFKYMVYMYASKLLISSESKGHSYNIRIQKGKLKERLENKKVVFLQHGVTALKKVDYVFKKTKTNAVNLFIVTSDYEKEIINQYFGYENDEISVTGFARWDLLEDKSKNKNSKRKIFMMPTWRSWMDGIPKEDFLKTNYYKNYKALLESETLKKMLTLNNVELHFLLHPKFLEFSKEFVSNDEKIFIHTFGEIQVNEYLMESSLLITDYSSVSWDMYYQKKPIIFYQFDVDQYNKYQGSYMDFEKDLFGDVAYNENQLLDYINFYLINDFKEKEHFAQKRSTYFAYNDKNNSERIYNAIMESKNLGVESKRDVSTLFKAKNKINVIVKKLRNLKPVFSSKEEKTIF